MTSQREAIAPPTAIWYLYSEKQEPLGQIYRRGEEAVPVVGAQVTDGARWKRVEVVSFEELRATCMMRRFSVVVRIIN